MHVWYGIVLGVESRYSIIALGLDNKYQHFVLLWGGYMLFPLQSDSYY